MKERRGGEGGGEKGKKRRLFQCRGGGEGEGEDVVGRRPDQVLEDLAVAGVGQVKHGQQ